MSRSRKTWVCSLLLLSLPLLILPAVPRPARADGWPQTGSAACAVLEASSGRLLYAENGEQPLPPASTCKIATALLTLALTDDLQRPVVISEAAAAVGESSIDLRAGEVLSVADLLRGALIRSGNDACFALAEAVAGSEPLFVHWLNLQALLLGAYSACFRNTNGLPAAGHLISAADLARLTARALLQPFFADTVASKYAELGGESNYRYYRNTNRLLWQDERVAGVKTGTTDEAGPCLVAALREGEALYISVVFNCPDRYGASLRLLEEAAARGLLLRPVRRGQALAVCRGELLYAARDAVLLLSEGEAGAVRLRWELPDRLLFLDEQGRELARVPLTSASAPAGSTRPVPN